MATTKTDEAVQVKRQAEIEQAINHLFDAVASLNIAKQAFSQHDPYGEYVSSSIVGKALTARDYLQTTAQEALNSFTRRAR